MIAKHKRCRNISRWGRKDSKLLMFTFRHTVVQWLEKRSRTTLYSETKGQMYAVTDLQSYSAFEYKSIISPHLQRPRIIYNGQLSGKSPYRITKLKQLQFLENRIELILCYYFILCAYSPNLGHRVLEANLQWGVSANVPSPSGSKRLFRYENSNALKVNLWML